MHPSLLPTLLASSLLIPLTTPLGINCRGSVQCNPNWNVFLPTDVNIIAEYHEALAYGDSSDIPGGPIPDAHIFHSGAHIACLTDGHLCLFMQGNVPAGGVRGAVIKARMEDLRQHGCQYCGSVPLSGDNNPERMGVLTSNFVTGPICTGVCQFS